MLVGELFFFWTRQQDLQDKILEKEKKHRIFNYRINMVEYKPY
jgi:hypothetical protein